MNNSMSLDEIQANIIAINNASQDIGRRLLEMREREAWKVLGYASWTAFLEGEFSYSRKHLYELMNAASVLEVIPKGNKISTAAAAKLSQYPKELHIPIIQATQARYGAITESRLQRVGDMFQEVTRTGHCDTGNGISTPIDIALDKADDEADKRQKQYIYDKPQKPLTQDEISLAISTITANPSDQSVARAVRSILRIQERKQAG